MREGVILVEGSTGDDAGLQMRRGVIAISGSAGVGLGRGMMAGTIVALGNVGSRAGAGMKRGTLVLPALDRDSLDHLLPTFALAGSFSLPFLSLYARQIRDWGFTVPQAVFTARLERYNGDLAVGGQGEILVGRHVA
jgi:formylmethanofuran dehydrogenase subunit C